jgi:hypothetical protein
MKSTDVISLHQQKEIKVKIVYKKRIILLVLQRLKIVRIIKKESLVLIEEVKD